MTMKRKSTHIEGHKSLIELVVALQLDGHLDKAALPGWAHGTSVEETFEAVRALGDGAWLESIYANHGQYEAADAWLAAFLDGEAVPVKADTARERANSEIAASDGGDDADGAEESQRQLARALEEYVKGLPPKSASIFRTKMADPAFLKLSLALVNSCGEALPSAYLLPDEDFAQAQKNFLFLKPASVKAPEHAELAKHYLVDNYETVFQTMAELPGDRIRALKRVKALGAKLGKAIEKANS